MGTAISIAAPDDTDPVVFRGAVTAAFARLRHADEVFSTYLPDSPVSRIRDGRLALEDLRGHPDGDEIRAVLALCAELKQASGGAFDAFAVGDPPAFDPSGAVKGLAAEQAGALLAALGLPRHALNAGGDVRVCSAPGDTAPWRVGIADPHRAGSTLTVLHLARGAVATSGTAERGPHITGPLARRPATALASVTVTGPDLALADGYATAAAALAGTGDAARAHAWLIRLADTGYEALTVDQDAGVWWTPGLNGLAPGLPPHPAAARAAEA